MRSSDTSRRLLGRIAGAAGIIGAGMLASCASVDGDAGGATSLFNGRTLEGWVRRGGVATFAVEDGCIVGRTAPNQPNTFLCSERTFRDFDLELEFKVDPALNSGVQVRSESRPDFKSGVVHGYQVEIDPSDRAWTGGLYDESRRGWLVDLKDKPDARAAFRQGQWNQLRVRIDGDRFDTWLNGVPVVQDFHDGMTPEGFIALQVHGVGNRAEPLEIRWRNIRLREPARSR
jgi:hypothetical protein